MTVLRAALLFDHPTTRLFASRILESFFFAPSSSVFSTTLARSFPRVPAPRSSRVYPGYFSVTVPPLRISLPPPLPPTHRRGPVPSFRASHLLSRSSVNKRTRAKEESKAFRVPSPSPSPPPAVYRCFFFFFLFLVSSHTALLTFAKLSEWLRWEKRRVHSRDGNGIIRPYERSTIASHAKSVAFANCKCAGISFAHSTL